MCWDSRRYPNLQTWPSEVEPGSGAVKVHVGSEAAFVPARKAHPALTIRGLRPFIADSGLDATWNDEIEGLVRCHVYDPFGNRVELVDADTIHDTTAEVS